MMCQPRFSNNMYSMIAILRSYGVVADLKISSLQE